MLPKFPKPCSLLVLLVLICFTTLTQAQKSYTAITYRIDSLANIGLPKSALAEVDKLDLLARKNNNTSQVIRAVIYRITFQSYLEENALVTIINTLKADIEKSGFPAKPVLQSMLADMYWRYYQQNRWQIAQRTRLQNPDPDFTRWDLHTLIAQTNLLYQQSLHQESALQKTPVNVLDGVLTGNQENRYLRPTLYDFLVHRAFEFYLGEEPALPKPRLPFNLNDARLFSDSRTFALLPVTTADTTSTVYQGVKYLQQATNFHISKNNAEALADLDMRRLQFLHGKSALPNKNSLYIQALKTITQTFAAKPISADAWVLLGNYYKSRDSLNAAHQYYNKAVAAFPQSMGGKNAAVLTKQIEETSLLATVEDVNVPNKPLLAQLQYRNLKKAQVLLYKLSQAQLKVYNSLYNDAMKYPWSGGKSTDPSLVINYLDKLKPLQTQTLLLPQVQDYRNHITEFKIDALKPGKYVLLVKKGEGRDTSLTQVTDFDISKLAFMARLTPDAKMEYRVMNRETGEPLKNVSINVSRRSYKYNEAVKKSEYIDVEQHGVTDKQGMFITPKIEVGQVAVKLTIKGDTLIEGNKYINGQLDKEDDDEDPEEKTILFTDRQIYRPGQTIYFKGMQISTLKRKSKIVTGKTIDVKFKGANNQEIGKQTFKTNEFGTFSGTFIIPQNILNGNISIETEDGDIDVKAEEYKRPTFQVEFNKLTESYRFNDSVKVKGKVMTFSGYGLSQARVAYRVRRSRNWVDPVAMRAVYGSSYTYEEPVEIAVDTVNTDNQGNYAVKFKALPGDKLLSSTTYRYEITANATDASGETREGSTDVTIGRRDISLLATVPNVLFAKYPANIEVDLTTLNNRKLKGAIKVQIHALQAPSRLFKKRLWTIPDQYLLTPADYENFLPDYAYGNQDQFAYWPKKNKVMETSVVAVEAEKTTINLEELGNQLSGVYQVFIQAQAANGDTASVTRYINLINKPASTVSLNNWVIPVLNSVKAGEKAEFLVSAGSDAYVLSEYYEGAKLRSSEWIKPGSQRYIKVPANKENEDNKAVQFMMVFHNRLYNSYQPVYVLHPEKKLDLKLMTFRDKLQPGQKEQWKLQVSGYKDDKQAAEMVAAMYDISLDDITTPKSWDNMLLSSDRQYRYFAWNDYDFTRQQSTQSLFYRNNTYNTQPRTYEQLNLFGYSYYGGYNNGYQQYLRNSRELAKIREHDEQLEADYLKNAALVTNGYIINGKVVSEAGSELAGVSVKIKGSEIGTTANSKGYFKIKVPVNGSLVFSYIGFESQEKLISKAEKLTIKLKSNGNSLNDVVVVAYDVQSKKELTGAVTRVQINGKSTLAGVLQGKVAGVVTESNANEIFTSVEVTYPDGSRRVNGRLVPASKAMLNDEMYGNAHVSNAVQPITIRKNFNETAFFYPQLHTDEKGQILMDFTMPESLTKWRFKAFAHTQNLATGYLQQDVITQKQLMISANMPRFMREGDTITVSARVANLTAETLKSKVQLQLFNALTMQPVILLMNPDEAIQTIEIAANSNKAVSFKMVIPAKLDALTYRITAASDTYSDGEENTLPVLPNRMLVTESMLIMVRAGQTKAFTFDKLVNQKSNTLVNKTLTLEYTQNPAWYAVQALPYLMEFPYECSEQIFSRYYANCLSASIVNRNSQIKTVFDRWKATDSKELLSKLEQNHDLKATLIEETPWLQNAVSESEQKKRITLLYDLNKLSYEQEQSIDKLLKKQLPNGGFPWFGGEYTDRYITQHIIAGIGQLYHLKIAEEANQKLKTISTNALHYLDAEILNDDSRAALHSNYKSVHITPTEIHAWYARSYYHNAQLSGTLKIAQQLYLNRAIKQWVSQNIYQQALIALTMQRYGKPGVAKAIIRSLMETAQQSNDLGMYWTKNQLGWYWYQSPVETQALMIELFTEAGNEPKAVEEMKVWLLRNKQTNNWRTTKATAAACYALLMKGDSLLTGTATSTIKLNNKPLTELKPDIKAEAGTGYIKTSWADEQVKPALGRVEVANSGKTLSWGALHWQYIEQMDKITLSSTDIKLERKYFIEKQDNAGAVLIAVDAEHQPKTGDLLKVVIYLKAGRDYEYVQLKDMRPAGTEPVDVLSAFKYQDGLYFYQVTKDVATNFFISQLNKGNYVFEYRLRVAQPGNFSTGISSVQSMYAPEFNAHSEGRRLQISK